MLFEEYINQLKSRRVLAEKGRKFDEIGVLTKEIYEWCGNIPGSWAKIRKSISHVAGKELALRFIKDVVQKEVFPKNRMAYWFGYIKREINK